MKTRAQGRVFDYGYSRSLEVPIVRGCSSRERNTRRATWRSEHDRMHGLFARIIVAPKRSCIVYDGSFINDTSYARPIFRSRSKSSNRARIVRGKE